MADIILDENPRQGESRRFEVTYTANAGTYTVDTDPAPLVSVFPKLTRTPLTNFDGIAADDYSSVPGVTVSVSHTVDFADTDFSAGVAYVIQFVTNLIDSDLEEQLRIYEMEFTLLDGVEAVA